MAAEMILFTIVYWFFAAAEITGMVPQEFRSLGFYLQSILDNFGWFGYEELNFVKYHLKRTTIMVVVHSLLPVLYVLAVYFMYPNSILHSQWYTQLLVVCSMLVTCTGVAVGYYWYRGNWKQHPLLRDLAHCQEPIYNVISDINAQFRDIDKFTSVLGAHRVVVTDTWILKICPHSVKALRQYDSVINIAKSDEHLLAVEGIGTAQYLTIEVISANRYIKSFDIRLNSLEYAQFKEKITAPVRTARSIVIRQTLSEQFVLAFADQVNRNPRFDLPHGSPMLETCIGCLQRMSEVKLTKMCDEETTGPCRSCQCRPMWCLGCMAKWFASRQDQSNPQSWMTGTAPCPMCRATFCVLDVTKVT